MAFEYCNKCKAFHYTDESCEPSFTIRIQKDGVLGKKEVVRAKSFEIAANKWVYRLRSNRLNSFFCHTIEITVENEEGVAKDFSIHFTFSVKAKACSTSETTTKSPQNVVAK